MKKTIISIIILIGLIFGGIFIYTHLKGSSKTSNKYKKLSFIYNDKDIDKSDFAKINGQYYISLDFIKNNLDNNINYDKKEDTIIFTNSKGIKRFKIGAKEGYVNAQKIGLRDPLIKKNNKILIPSEAFIYDYPVKFRYIKTKNLLLLDNKDIEYPIGTLKNKTNIREKDDISSPIVEILNKDSKVYVCGEKNKFYKVRNIDGYLGYIKKNLVYVDFGKDKFKNKISIKNKGAEKPLNLTWDYTYSNQSNESINAIKKINGIDVIIPTWFSLKNVNGDIIDRGNINYVNNYKLVGIDVWGYLDNSFDPKLTEQALSSSSMRNKIILNILEKLKLYKMKGINIDFENININTKDLLTQFVKELSAICKANNIKVSIDVPPIISLDPKKDPYDRESLSKIVDYLIIMTYDQHGRNSKKIGSVAEYKWVENNLNSILRNVEHNKIILGIPLYSRLWNTNDSKKEVKSQSLSMNQVQALINKNNLKVSWDDVAKQNYVEYNEDGKKIKIWIENAKSIAWKTSLVNKYNLSGVASWRKGYETSDVWEVINQILSKIK